MAMVFDLVKMPLVLLIRWSQWWWRRMSKWSVDYDTIHGLSGFYIMLFAVATLGPSQIFVDVSNSTCFLLGICKHFFGEWYTLHHLILLLQWRCNTSKWSSCCPNVFPDVLQFQEFAGLSCHLIDLCSFLDTFRCPESTLILLVVPCLFPYTSFVEGL